MRDMCEFMKDAYFAWDDTQLFCRQVVKLKNEPPVEVSITVQGSVVNISLLFLVLHTWHPSRKQSNVNSDIISEYVQQVEKNY